MDKNFGLNKINCYIRISILIIVACKHSLSHVEIILGCWASNFVFPSKDLITFFLKPTSHKPHNHYIYSQLKFQGLCVKNFY